MKKLIAVIVLSFVFQASAGGKKLLILDSQDGEPYESARIAMIKELNRRGFIEDKTISIIRKNAKNKAQLAERILTYEAHKGYDVIFVNGTIANIAAYRFGYKKPEYKFVFCSITDPVGIGLIKRLNSPSDSNFTGVAYPVSVEKRLLFLKEAMPKARKIGFIYADMPQSRSYLRWFKDALKKPEFRKFELIYRKVEFVKSNKGHKRMAQLARRHVVVLNDMVDLFMTPCDQLGTKREFAQVVSNNSDKPLMALTEKEIKESWGAHFGLYMVQSSSGKKAGEMVARLLNGEKIKNIIPVNPKGEYGINMKLSKKIGLKYPRSVLRKAGKNIVY